MRRRGFCCTCDIPGEKDPKDQGIREKGLDGAQQKQPENVHASAELLCPSVVTENPAMCQRSPGSRGTESSPRAHSSTAFIQKRRFLSSLRKKTNLLGSKHSAAQATSAVSTQPPPEPHPNVAVIPSRLGATSPYRAPWCARCIPRANFGLIQARFPPQTPLQGWKWGSPNRAAPL